MKINKACRTIQNKDKTVIANICTGKWMLIPTSCWQIVQTMNDNDLSIEDICELAVDEEDERYLSKIEKITEKMEEIEVRGQGCWDDCEIWKNNTTASSKNKCRRDFTAYNNIFK